LGVMHHSREVHVAEENPKPSIWEGVKAISTVLVVIVVCVKVYRRR
jgi:hypothetical protein